ncbi:Transmembrane protein 53 [Sparganum proliferum]
MVGMYDTTARKAIFEQVNDRSWPSLKAVIKKWVAPGSIIVTDQWKAYGKLNEEGYRHHTVNHSKNFVDPTSG